MPDQGLAHPGGLSPILRVDDASSSQSRESELRKALLEIQQNELLTAREKAQKMQELMTSGHSIKRSSSRSSGHSRHSSARSSLHEDRVSELAADDALTCPEDLEPSKYSKDGPSDRLGCAHYMTNCKFLADCCKNWYCCRFCHDEANDHVMDRYAVKYMLCMFCKAVQNAAQSCKHCNRKVASYYCNLCKLWDDDAQKQIFHCDKCRICRKGRREDYRHCDKCGGCISLEYFPQHKCLDRSLQSNCPICGENLFVTVHPIMFMPCGHSIHYLCHQEHSRSSYQCPICLKSISNMTHFFQRIDQMMTTQQMPEEYAHVRSQILCNDCERKSAVAFHFMYHRCEYCQSYNTKVLKTFNELERRGQHPSHEGSLSRENESPSSVSANPHPLEGNPELGNNIFQ